MDNESREDVSNIVTIKEEASDNDIQKLEEQTEKYFYALVGNIPSNFRSSDLRNFFSAFAEEDKFDCFHFRHRPQIVNITNLPSTEATSTKSTLCSLVRFPANYAKDSDSIAGLFQRKYHGKFWMDRAGNELQGRCVIQTVKLSPEELIKFRKELHPPRYMPKGNVGTCNAYFLGLIKQCVLPPSLIKKLNLEFPRARKYKKYSKVPFNYGTRVEEAKEDPFDEENVRTGRGHLISDAPTASKYKFGTDERNHLAEDEEANSDPNDDDDLCEEWERHEALNNDVTSQERSKERLYEEEIELVWEKGGPGIVWYTDAQYWDAQRGNFDERTADDLDVDMEGYYVEGGGDKDARDLMEMRQSDRFRDGLDEDFSVFKRPVPPPRPRANSSTPAPSTSTSHRYFKVGKSSKIGEFEQFTKGFGRKFMEKQGWKDGVGLGTTKNPGIPDALDGDGQVPMDKRGVGYHGEKIEWGSKRKRPKHSHASNPFGMDEDDRVIIGTIYDKPKDLDKEELLQRSNAPTFVKRY